MKDEILRKLRRKYKQNVTLFVLLLVIASVGLCAGIYYKSAIILNFTALLTNLIAAAIAWINGQIQTIVNEYYK